MTTTDAGTAPPISLLLAELDRLITASFERALGHRGCTRRQWQVLNLLATEDRTIDELTDRLAAFLDRSAGETAQEHVSPLIDRGLVHPGGDSCRLTELGHAELRALAAEVTAIRGRTTDGLSDAEYAAVIDGLQRMISNLRRSGGTATQP